MFRYIFIPTMLSFAFAIGLSLGEGNISLSFSAILMFSLSFLSNLIVINLIEENKNES